MWREGPFAKQRPQRALRLTRVLGLSLGCICLGLGCGVEGERTLESDYAVADFSVLPLLDDSMGMETEYTPPTSTRVVADFLPWLGDVFTDMPSADPRNAAVAVRLPGKTRADDVAQLLDGLLSLRLVPASHKRVWLAVRDAAGRHAWVQLALADLNPTLWYQLPGSTEATEVVLTIVPDGGECVILPMRVTGRDRRLEEIRMDNGERYTQHEIYEALRSAEFRVQSGVEPPLSRVIHVYVARQLELDCWLPVLCALIRESRARVRLWHFWYM